jgi:hypothetical protein
MHKKTNFFKLPLQSPHPLKLIAIAPIFTPNVKNEALR